MAIERGINNMYSDKLVELLVPGKPVSITDIVTSLEISRKSLWILVGDLNDVGGYYIRLGGGMLVRRVKPLTTEQKDTYYIIIKTAHGFGVKRNQIITFALGIMNTMFPDINEKDATELCNGVQDRFDAVS
jgi:hypothetical protein